MRTTTNLGLNVPEWADTIQSDIAGIGENFDKIDGLVWRGTQAEYDALSEYKTYITYLIEEG